MPSPRYGIVVLKNMLPPSGAEGETVPPSYPQRGVARQFVI